MRIRCWTNREPEKRERGLAVRCTVWFEVLWWQVCLMFRANQDPHPPSLRLSASARVMSPPIGPRRERGQLKAAEFFSRAEPQRRGAKNESIRDGTARFNFPRTQKVRHGCRQATPNETGAHDEPRATDRTGGAPVVLYRLVGCFNAWTNRGHNMGSVFILIYWCWNL